MDGMLNHYLRQPIMTDLGVIRNRTAAGIFHGTHSSNNG